MRGARAKHGYEDASFEEALTGLPAVPALGALAPAKGNPADALLALPIDDYRYDHATRCKKHPTPGMVALQAWLERNVRGTSWGIMRCERRSGTSTSTTAPTGGRRSA